MLSVIYADCHLCRVSQKTLMLSECHYAECRSAECRYAECCGAIFKTVPHTSVRTVAHVA
jgi:hypothetical protein